jgi:predicted nuclease of predicted toxin-antitoxin system
MRILVDENIPRTTVAWLRELGHDVLDIRGSALQGSADSGLWKLALSDQRMLVTTDKGFTNRRSSPHHGILIVRLRQPNRRKIHESVMVALERFPADSWPGSLVVVRDASISVSKWSGSAGA